MKQLRREAKAAQGLVLKDELKSRRRALRRLGYLADEGVVTDKGADWRCRRAVSQSYCQGSIAACCGPHNSTRSEHLSQAEARMS